MNIAKISEKVFFWFLQNREDYIFRKDRNPYRIWISEVALQQTRLSTALPYLEKFFCRFPNIETLYVAKENEVLMYWAGLGYYRRGRQIYRAAQILMEKYQGVFPNNFRELRQIPSIGPYTAAMILSLCYGEKILAVDGNIKRIFSRLFAKEDPIDSKAFEDHLKSISQDLFLPNILSGEINEAFMEFGQKICRVKPRCHNCFLQKDCLAYQKNLVEILPQRKRIKVKEEIFWHGYWIEQNGKILVQRNNHLPLLKEMYILPSVLEFRETKKEQRSFSKENLSKQKLLSAKPIRHAIMHYKIKGYLYEASLKEAKTQENFMWVSREDLPLYFHSSLMKKFLKEYEANLFVLLG